MKIYSLISVVVLKIRKIRIQYLFREFLSVAKQDLLFSYLI